MSLPASTIPRVEQVMASCHRPADSGCLCAVCLARHLGGDSAQIPTKEQARVIESDPRQPMLVVAGAGSGKTTTMADRVVWLCANGHVRPDQILGVTFTKKAAGQLSRKISEQLAKLAESGLIPLETLLAGQVPVSPPAGNPAAPGHEQVSPEAVRDLLAPAVSTYNAYANTLITQYGTLIGVEPHSALAGDATLWNLVRSLVDRLSVSPNTAQNTAEDTSDGTPEGAVDVGILLDSDRSPQTVARDVLTMSAECAEHGQDPLEVASWLGRLIGARRERHQEPPSSAEYGKYEKALRYRREVAILAADYNQARRAEGLMSFSDQLSGALEIAQQVPRASVEQRQQYKVVLLDEFQDTSHVQAELFATIFGSGHSVTAVGDPNQSIYGFRGASAGQLFAFRDRFPTATGAAPEVSYLTTAWRNAPAILESANALLNYFGSDATLSQRWHRSTAYQTRQLCGPTAPHRLTPNPFRDASDPGVVSLQWYQTSTEEAHGVVDHLVAATSRLAQRRGASQRPVERAVLARSHRQLDAVAEELSRRGIAYERSGLAGLLATAEVHDVLTYLTVLAIPERSDMVLRILASDAYRLGPRDLYAMGLHLRMMSRRAGGQPRGQQTLLDAAADIAEKHRRGTAESATTIQRISPEARDRIAEFWDTMEQLRHGHGHSLTALVERVCALTGLSAELNTKHAAYPETATYHLSAFIEEVEGFEAAEPQADIRALVDWTTDAMEQEKGLDSPPSETDPHAVQLMTMHAAKGLEWDIVATVGWRGESFPKGSATDPWTSASGALPWPLRGDAKNLPHWGAEASGEAWVEENTSYTWEMWRYLIEGTPKKCQHDTAEIPYLEQLRTFREEEDRRLAYVAVTRAAHELIITGSLFSGNAKGTQAKGGRHPKLKPSVFLEEVAEANGLSHQLAAQHESFTAVQNPESLVALEAQWPQDPLAGRTAYRVSLGEQEAAGHRDPSPHEVRLSGPSRRHAVDAAAQDVLQARSRLIEGDTGASGSGNVRRSAAEDSPEASAPSPSPDSSAALSTEVQHWVAEQQLILAQRAKTTTPSQIAFPEHLSASALVALAQDRSAALTRMRRPVPQEPREELRRGTLTHQWIEDLLGNIQQPLFSADQVHPPSGKSSPGAPGSGEAHAPTAGGNGGTPSTESRFRASSWAQRTAYAVEMSFATAIGGTMIRGQIDAIYGYSPGQGRDLTVTDKERFDLQHVQQRNARMGEAHWHLVDWKTGKVPPAEGRWARTIQLAVYRLAFHRMYGVALEDIQTSFHYLGEGEGGTTVTVDHQELPTEAELETLLQEAKSDWAAQHADTRQ